DGREIRKKTIILQSAVVIFAAFLILMLSPFIAGLLKDPDLCKYIRLLSVLLIIRGINCLFENYFNGYREFGQQAVLVMINSVPKIFFVLLFLGAGYGMYGLLAGYAFAPLLGIIFGLIFFKPRTGSRGISYSRIIRFSFPAVIYSFFFYLINSMDLFFIKASDIPEDQVGFYASARIISTAFFIISLTFSFTLLPSISKSFSANDGDKTVSYINSSLRYVFIAFMPVAIIISTNSEKILGIFFTHEYIRAAHALSILIWGWFLLQIFYIIASMINATGKSKIPAFIAGAALGVSVMGNYYLVNHYGIEGGATATLLAGIFSFTAGLFFIYRIFKISTNFLSIARISSASIVLSVIAHFINAQGVLFIVMCILLFVIYYAILFIIKEINQEDIKLAKELLGRQN
ncbi:MAG: oligosaccharide flippase family protein, partial [bacterium]